MQTCLMSNRRRCVLRTSTFVGALVLLAWAASAEDARPKTPPAADEAEAGKDGWRLVWSDEFDREGPPDPEKWNFETGFVRNQELQWYQPENARVEKGVLVIEARRERKPNPRYEAGSRDWRHGREHADYTSASLTTARKHTWQYGRFEVRARIDARNGLWPAIWTLGARGRWPACGEIDVMEYYRGLILANVAWSARDNPPGHTRRGHQIWEAWWDDRRIPLDEFGGAKWANEFHVWRLDWDERDIRIYVDDRLLKHVELKDTESAVGTSAFRQPHYLLLNLAVGGSQGGDPSTTEFPGRFEVDYVRVYQKQATAGTAGDPGVTGAEQEPHLKGLKPD